MNLKGIKSKAVLERLETLSRIVRITAHYLPCRSGKLGPVRKHFRRTCPMLQQTLGSGRECLIHFLLRQHKIRSRELRSADK